MGSMREQKIRQWPMANAQWQMANENLSPSLVSNRDAFVAGGDGGVQGLGMRGDGAEEIQHLVLLVDHVVGHEEATGRDARKHEIEELLVVGLPGVEEDE